MNASEASYIWGIPSGHIFEPCSLEYRKMYISFVELSPSNSEKRIVIDDMLPKETFKS